VDDSLTEFLVGLSTLVVVIVGLLAIVAILARVGHKMTERRFRNVAMRRTAPAGASFGAVASLYVGDEHLWEAVMVDLAVRGKVRIFWRKEGEDQDSIESFGIEVLDLEGLAADEMVFLTAQFRGGSFGVGSKMDFMRGNVLDHPDDRANLEEKIVNKAYFSALTQALHKGGFLREAREPRKGVIISKNGRYGDNLTERGMEARREMMGLEKFMRMPEAERSGMSLEEREKLLPYALVFDTIGDGWALEMDKMAGAYWDDKASLLAGRKYRPDWLVGREEMGITEFCQNAVIAWSMFIAASDQERRW
jgi:hypothetical protein